MFARVFSCVGGRPDSRMRAYPHICIPCSLIHSSVHPPAHLVALNPDESVSVDHIGGIVLYDELLSSDVDPGIFFPAITAALQSSSLARNVSQCILQTRIFITLACLPFDRKVWKPLTSSIDEYCLIHVHVFATIHINRSLHNKNDLFHVSRGE